MKALKIIGLSVDGIRKLKAFEMKFSETGLTIIKGANRAGKSTVIDSLTILLRGFSKKYCPDDIITHGGDKGEIIGYIADYIIKRVITDKTNRLEVIKKMDDGLEVEIKNAQTFLDALTNELTFNPFPFLDKTPEEKVKFIMGLSGVNFSEINEQIKNKENERVLKGRELKGLGVVEEIILEEGEVIEKVNVSDLLTRKSEIDNNNIKKRDEYHKKLADLQYVEESKEKCIKFFSDNINHVKTNATAIVTDNNILIHNNLKILKEKFEKFVESGEKLLSELPKPEEVVLEEPHYESTTDLEIKLSNADSVNEKFVQQQAYLEYVNKRDMLQADYNKMTGEIEKLRSEKRDMLKKASIIEGLELREEGLFYNDIYSENWSRSEGAIISSKIWKVTNPKLQAIFIDSGEQYDKESLLELEKWSLENDIQVILTKVADEPSPDDVDNVIFIEDGNIV